MIERNHPCWCGSGIKWKHCHYPQQNSKSIASYTKDDYRRFGVLIKTEEQIAGIRTAGHMAAKILNAVCERAKAGVTTLELNDFAHQLHLEAGAIPAPLGYGTPPFPKSICTSLNEVICHGIPNKDPLKTGDILNIDVTVLYQGYYGDCSRMVSIGDVAADKKRVVDVAYECLERSTKILRPGLLLSAIGDIIEEYATANGCSVVNQFVGHGVGVRFHEGPQVMHYKNQLDLPLVAGMTFTIEPMINAGVREGVIDPRNQWEARTVDRKPSAQYEYTLLITENGYENLTPWSSDGK